MRVFRSLTTLPLVALLASCGAPPTPSAPPPSAPLAPPAPALAQTPAPAPAPAPRPPAPLVAVPMPGEPPVSALAEARLEATSCAEDASKLEARVRAMRAEVDAEFARWRAAQPECWREYRRRWEEEKAAASMGYGGLGLSGVGEGGGGVGYGIGLGSIGTIGHGRASVRGAGVASRTNVQVEGVDEADLVKTDGRYVYLAVNGALRIFEALRPRLVSVTKLPGDARELFVEGDRAVVYSSVGARSKPCTYGYDCVFAGDGSQTRVSVIDLASREAPRVARQIELSGSLMAARRVGNAVHTVVADGDAEPMRRAGAYTTWPDDLAECGTPEATVRAKFAALKVENERRLRAATPTFPTMVDRGKKTALCGSLLRSPVADGQAYTTVVSFDLAKDDEPPVTATLESRPGAVFASEGALYVAVSHRKGGGGRWYSFASASNEVSDVHKFRIGKSPRDTRYVASGVVPGHVLNQFAMDEREGALRIATTRGKVPDPKVESAVSVLAEAGGALVRVGAVEHLAPGEDLRAVRFDGDRGYVVTFKKTDPLFVLDLADPAHPGVLGELKIPGFSTYLHRIDRDHLMSIGFDADDHGDFAYFDGLLLQLFDVTRPTEPKLLHRAKLGTRGSSSEAATNHLAFNYLPERGLLAIPTTLCEGGGDGRQGTLSFSGLVLFDVSLEKGFARLGGVDHGKAGASCSAWWSNAASHVKRSVFLDDLVWSIALDRAKVQRMGALGQDVAELALAP